MKIFYMTSIQKRVLVFTILYVLFFAPVAYSQKAVELTKNNRKLILPIGKRVKYKLNDGFVGVGRIQFINDSSLTIDDKNIKLSEFDKIGRKNPGSNFRGIFLTTLGSIFALSVISNDQADGPSCTGCQPANTSSTTTKGGSIAPGIIVGLGITCVGISILSRNATNDLSNAWTMKIIDQPKNK